MGYVVWRITRPTVHTPARAGGASGLRLEDGRAHRERADELARAGRYVEALAHRFVALLLELERRRALTVHPSKTPAEYVREARLDESGRASFADLVARLYRHVFGAVPCDAATYQDFGAAADAVFRHVAAALARGRARARPRGGGGGRGGGARRPPPTPTAAHRPAALAPRAAGRGTL